MAIARTKMKRPVTARELMRMGDGRRELIHGTVVEHGFGGARHGVVCAGILSEFWRFARKRRLGTVLAGSAGFHVESRPDHVLAADAALVRDNIWPPRWSFLRTAPDLAVEVLDREDSMRAARQKAGDWLAHGTHEVWIVDPRRRNATIHRQGSAPARIARTGALTSPDLLPGFRLRLRDVFACLD